jgi:hypothetical protein
MRTALRASINCTDTEPIIQYRARYRARCRARCRTVRRALIERLRRIYGQSKGRIKPESRYQHVTVTESKHSNIVKLEPSTGPTLFLNRTTTDCSITVTAIRIQYCQPHNENRRRGKEGPVKGSSIILENKHRGTIKQYTKRHCKTREDRCSARDRT